MRPDSVVAGLGYEQPVENVDDVRACGADATARTVPR